MDSSASRSSGQSRAWAALRTLQGSRKLENRRSHTQEHASEFWVCVNAIKVGREGHQDVSVLGDLRLNLLLPDRCWRGLARAERSSCPSAAATLGLAASFGRIIGRRHLPRLAGREGAAAGFRQDGRGACGGRHGGGTGAAGQFAGSGMFTHIRWTWGGAR